MFLFEKHLQAPFAHHNRSPKAILRAARLHEAAVGRDEAVPGLRATAKGVWNREGGEERKGSERHSAGLGGCGRTWADLGAEIRGGSRRIVADLGGFRRFLKGLQGFSEGVQRVFKGFSRGFRSVFNQSLCIAHRSRILTAILQIAGLFQNV